MVTRIISQMKTSSVSNYKLLFQTSTNNILAFCFPSKVLIVRRACFLHTLSSPFQCILQQFSVFRFVVCICSDTLVLGMLNTKLLKAAKGSRWKQQWFTFKWVENKRRVKILMIIWFWTLRAREGRTLQVSYLTRLLPGQWIKRRPTVEELTAGRD